jgi:hypothetical protein
MRSFRWLIWLLWLVLPLAARADKSKKSSDQVEVWPPEPSDSDSDKPSQPSKPNKSSKKDKSKKSSKDKSKDETATTKEPLNFDDEDEHKAENVDPADKDKAKAEPAENTCEPPFTECKEDCTIEHSNDDTSKLKGMKPLEHCLKKCQAAFDGCEERRAEGLIDERHDDGAER